jgi:hypothetical protein
VEHDDVVAALWISRRPFSTSSGSSNRSLKIITMPRWRSWLASSCSTAPILVFCGGLRLLERSEQVAEARARVRRRHLLHDLLVEQREADRVRLLLDQERQRRAAGRRVVELRSCRRRGA